jgi:hypothetical protein
MWKATIGIVAGLALITSTARATEKPNQTTDARGGAESAPVQIVDASGAATAAEAGRGNEVATSSEEVRASRDAKASRAEKDGGEDSWLQMREGYRDGGY